MSNKVTNFEIIEKNLRQLDQLMQSILNDPYFIVEGLLEQGIYYDYKSDDFKEFKIETIIGGELLDVKITPYELVKCKSLNNLLICDSINITIDNNGFTEKELFEFLKTLTFNYVTICHIEDLFVFKTDVIIEFDATNFIEILKIKIADLIIDIFSNNDYIATTRGSKSNLRFIIERLY